MNINRELVVNLHLIGKGNFEILEELKVQQINRRFIGKNE